MPENKPPVAHYNRGSVQFIDYLEGSFTPDEYRGFLKGQVIKYISRYRYKGSPAEDLLKARQYLEWLMEFERERATPPLNEDHPFHSSQYTVMEKHENCPECNGHGYYYTQRRRGKKIYPVGSVPGGTCGVSPFSRKHKEKKHDR